MGFVVSISKLHAGAKPILAESGELTSCGLHDGPHRLGCSWSQAGRLRFGQRAPSTGACCCLRLRSDTTARGAQPLAFSPRRSSVKPLDLSSPSSRSPSLFSSFPPFGAPSPTPFGSLALCLLAILSYIPSPLFFPSHFNSSSFPSILPLPRNLAFIHRPGHHPHFGLTVSYFASSSLSFIFLLLSIIILCFYISFTAFVALFVKNTAFEHGLEPIQATPSLRARPVERLGIFCFGRTLRFIQKVIG